MTLRNNANNPLLSESIRNYLLSEYQNNYLAYVLFRGFQLNKCDRDMSKSLMRNTWLWEVAGDPSMRPVVPSDIDGDSRSDDIDPCPDIPEESSSAQCNLCSNVVNANDTVTRIRFNLKVATTGKGPFSGLISSKGMACSDRRPQLFYKKLDSQDISSWGYITGAGSWSYKPEGIRMRAEMNNQCTVLLKTPVPSETYRVKLWYTWDGINNYSNSCKIVLRTTQSTKTIDYGYVYPKTSVVRLHSGNGKLCIYAKKEFSYDVCPDVVIQKVLMVPDKQYVFSHEVNTDSIVWTGPAGNLPGPLFHWVKKYHRIPLQRMVAVVEGSRIKPGQALITENNSPVLRLYPEESEIPYNSEDMKGYAMVKGGDHRFIGEIDYADDPLNRVCPVTLDPALEGGRRYLILIPYFVITEPWFEGETESQLRGTYYKFPLFQYSRTVEISRMGDSSPQVSYPIRPMFDDIDSYTFLQVHWGNVNELQIAGFIVNVDMEHDGAVLKFCQRGFGRYFVDNVVVVDLGPGGGE